MSEAEAQSSGVVQAPANPNGSQPAPAGVLDTTGMTQAEIDAANDRISKAVLPKGEVFLTTNAVEKVNAKAPRGYRYEPVSEPQTQTEVVSEKRQRKQVQYSDYGTEMDFGDGRKKKGLSMKGGKRGQVGSPGSAEGSAGKKRKMKMMNPMMPFSPDMVGMSAEYMQQMMAMQMAMMQAMMAGQNPAMMANPAMMGAMMPNANMTPTASKPRQSASSSGKRKGGGSAGKQNSSWDASYKLLNRVRAHKDAIWFNEPVDVVKFSCPDYYTVIKNPMDLGTIKNKMEHSEYRNISAFAEDVRLVWANCRSYNYPGSAIVLIADNLSAIFEKGLGPIVSNFGDVMSASEVAPADVDVSYTPVAPAPAPKKKSSSDGGKDKSKKKKKIQVCIYIYYVVIGNSCSGGYGRLMCWICVGDEEKAPFLFERNLNDVSLSHNVRFAPI